MPSPQDLAPPWQIGSRTLRAGNRPLIMGILNVTPDSFSDGSAHDSVVAAVAHGRKLIRDGADILDVGGESTRPGARPVPAEEELRRVLPVVQALAGETDVPISIDTTKAAVAAACCEAGAAIVNDISGLRFDPEMPALCASLDAGVVCMHIQGTPQTMQDNPHYDDCVGEISEHFQERLDALKSAGIAAERLALDPGIGFGKTSVHNMEILSSVATFRQLGRPVLIGHSRKGFLKKIIGREIDERLAGTIGVSIAVAAQGADIIRVHDVAGVRDAILAWQAVTERVDAAGGSGISRG